MVARVHGSNPTPKDFSIMNDVVNSQLAKYQERDTAVDFPKILNLTASTTLSLSLSSSCTAALSSGG